MLRCFYPKQRCTSGGGHGTDALAATPNPRAEGEMHGAWHGACETPTRNNGGGSGMSNESFLTWQSQMDFDGCSEIYVK
jgi:hypothetical protein